MKISEQSLDRLAMIAFGWFLAVCSFAVIGFIVFAPFGAASALAAAAAMTIVVTLIVLGLNQAVGSYTEGETR